MAPHSHGLSRRGDFVIAEFPDGTYFLGRVTRARDGVIHEVDIARFGRIQRTDLMTWSQLFVLEAYRVDVPSFERYRTKTLGGNGISGLELAFEIAHQFMVPGDTDPAPTQLALLEGVA